MVSDFRFYRLVTHVTVMLIGGFGCACTLLQSSDTFHRSFLLVWLEFYSCKNSIKMSKLLFSTQQKCMMFTMGIQHTFFFLF